MTTTTNTSLAKVPDGGQPPKKPAQGAGGNLPVKVGSRQSRHLAQAIQLEESGTSPLIRFSVMLTCVLCLVFFVWAAVTEVPEIAVAEGSVIPSGQVIPVQHLEGGVVDQVMVKEGDLVEEGQTIVKLSPAAALSDLEQTRAREAALLLRSERLRAFVEGREPNFTVAGKGYESLAADNRAIYNSQMQSFETARAVTTAQVNQKRADLALLKEQYHTIQEQVDALAQEVKLRQSLYNQHLITLVQFLDTKRELSRMQGELSRNMGQTLSAEDALNEVQNKLADQLATTHKQNMDELSTVIAELAQVQESIGRLEDRVNRLIVAAPARGYIKGLIHHYPGAVIQPGGVIAELVPVDRELTIEGKVDTKDVGHLHEGQRVKVKVQTYDPARYGVVWGTLRQVSANSFLDEKNKPYFKSFIGLEHDYVGDEPERYRVAPGMTVTAEIITGQKSLLQYMLKPIFTQMHESFHER
jgi:HlyD family secretion protein/adhesin transport system membrane fusion protein